MAPVRFTNDFAKRIADAVRQSESRVRPSADPAPLPPTGQGRIHRILAKTLADGDTTTGLYQAQQVISSGAVFPGGLIWDDNPGDRHYPLIEEINGHSELKTDHLFEPFLAMDDAGQLKWVFDSGIPYASTFLPFPSTLEIAQSTDILSNNEEWDAVANPDTGVDITRLYRVAIDPVAATPLLVAHYRTERWAQPPLSIGPETSIEIFRTVLGCTAE